MTENKINEFAIVRAIPNTYQDCVTIASDKPTIKVELAKQQHAAYCNTLAQLGLKLIRIDADDALPDCCFTEDTAIVFGDVAIITNPGTISRIAETVEMEKILIPLKKIHHLSSPATIDGGDVLKIEQKIFIGISSRSNEEAIKQVAAIINPKGYEVIGVKIRDTLHLKSVCTYVGNGCILLAEGHLDENIFSEYDIIIVPEEEAYAANCLMVNGQVLLPKGFPKTKSLVEAKGFSVIEMDMSEIEKADGALTCLSIIF
ncbi:MAG: arginine deiminase family protein [Chitinophagaceae bacterium]